MRNSSNYVHAKFRFIPNILPMSVNQVGEKENIYDNRALNLIELTILTVLQFCTKWAKPPSQRFLQRLLFKSMMASLDCIKRDKR